jgi:hypothetical protein
MTRIVFFCLWPSGSWDEEVIETNRTIRDNSDALKLFRKIHAATPIKPIHIEVDKIFAD